MTITAFDDVQEFQRFSEPLLFHREAEYNLHLGILASLVEHGWQGRYDALPLLAIVEDQQRLVGVVMRTPPHNLLLTDLPAGAIPHLTQWLRENHIQPPGVLAPKPTSDAFAAEWSRQTRQAAILSFAMRNHRLRSVIPPPTPPGALREAREDDFDLIVSWTVAFNDEAQITHARDPAPMVRRLLASRDLYLWYDDQPVALAAAGQRTPHGIRVNLVYTPPEHRRRGYATALVAQVSQHLLNTGRQFCFLFTDLANPTANNIYRKIGYEGVCDYAEYRFEGEGA